LVGKDIWVQYKVKLHFTTNFNHQYFPLNDHNIYISLTNHDLNAEEFILESHVSGAKIKQNFEIQDWKIIGSHSEAGFDYTEVPFKHIKSNPYPILMYTLDFKKAGLSKTNLILLPLILILFIVSSTILHPAMPQTLLVGVLCLTSILTYRYVINGLSPTVGYFTFADHIYNTSLMLTFFSFLIISLRQIYPELSHPYFDLSYFIFTKICMIGMFTYLLFFDNQKGSSKINIQKNIKSKKLHLSDWTLKKIEQRLLHYHENHFWSKFNYPIMSWSMLVDCLQALSLEEQDPILELELSNDKQYIIISNTHQALSLLTILKSLSKKNWLNDQLQLKDNVFIIFLQNDISNLETFNLILSIQVLLMMKNPSQVFYLQEHSFAKDLQQLPLNNCKKNKIFIRQRLLFNQIFQKYFAKHPISLNLTSSTHQQTCIEIENAFNPPLHYFDATQALPNIPIKIQHFSNKHFFYIQKGIFYYIPTANQIQWLEKRLDADMFTSTDYNLFYGFPATNNSQRQLKEPIVLGSSMDFTHTGSLFSHHLAQGLLCRLLHQNRRGGIKGHPLKINLFNDEYDPTYAKKNILHLMNTLPHPIMISPMGTPTTESYAPWIKEKKVMVLLPFTGSQSLRNTEYENIVFYFQNDAYGLTLMTKCHEICDAHKVQYIDVPHTRVYPNIENAVKDIKKFAPDALLFFSLATPANLLINTLGIYQISNIYLYAASPASDRILDCLKNLGKPLTFCQTVPPLDIDLEILEHYRQDLKETTFLASHSANCLEGYINASILCDILEKTDPPYTPENLLKTIEKIQHYNFKGLTLHFNAEKRELFDKIWIVTKVPK